MKIRQPIKIKRRVRQGNEINNINQPVQQRERFEEN